MADISSNQLKTIAVLDFAHGFGCMIVEQLPDEPGLFHMADELKKITLDAISLYDVESVTHSQKSKFLEMADCAIANFEETNIPGAAWTSFLLSLLESQLHIPKRKNGENKKNGWIKDKEKRQAIQDVYDLLVGIHLVFDPEYDDIDSACKGVKAGRNYV